MVDRVKKGNAKTLTIMDQNMLVRIDMDIRQSMMQLVPFLKARKCVI